nr:probable disease resistance protein At4g27220 [Quercus suber]
MIYPNSNIKNLKDQFQKLGNKRHGVQLEIDAAKRKGEIVATEVQSWVEKVDNISEELQRFLEEDVKANKMCLDGWCPNLKLRSYSLSRNAKKKTLEIDGLLKDGQFAKVSRPPPPPGMGSLSIIMDFESRTKTLKEVLEALRDDKINMIAICGMRGIGKTTMAKVVKKRAKDDKLFGEVGIVQTLDLKKIQDQIGEMLGLKFDEKYPLARPKRLKKRLMDSKSVLIILDDVRDALDLEAVGIPYGGQHNSCKILLTSISEEACTRMKSQKIFKIEVLSEEEAWNLFREMAGNCIDTPNLHPIAEAIAKECGGLPIAIVTVGRVLEKKSEVEWSAALQQLKNAIPKNIPGLDSKVYSCIELSYSSLKSDEAKSCFLLCCLFPEHIFIEFLVRYGVGQRLFTKIDTVAEARNRFHAILKNLIRSFLLLDSEEGEQFVKMHNVVRDVATSIAENQGILVRYNEKMEEWPEKDLCERSTAISLVSKELKRHPDGLECPKLELLQLHLCGNHTWQTLLPPNLFKGMNGLKVLSMLGMSLPSLPQSIHFFENLRTLELFDCELADVSAIGELSKLEILSIIGSKIKKLPGEIGYLSHLKLLDLTGCFYLERIPAGLLSSLSQLEELYMLGVSHVDWEPMEDNKEEEEEEEEEASASLAELKSFSHNLMALQIQIPNIKVLPKDLPFKNQMIKFQIFAGYMEEIDADNYVKIFDYIFKNSLALGRCDGSDIAESQTLLQLLPKSELLYLFEIKDLKNIIYELDKEGFQCLKTLEVHKSEDVQYVINATSHQTMRAAFPILEILKLGKLRNLKEIYHSHSHGRFPERSFTDAQAQAQQQLSCFGNLKSLQLSQCMGLKNVFSLSIARGLVQLQKLDIVRCVVMEEIFSKEGEDEKELNEKKTMFPQLTHIELRGLPRLIGFCTNMGPIELVQPSLNQEVGRIDTNEMTNLEKHNMTDIQQNIGSISESTPIISHKLFSPITILWPPDLENLDLRKANSLEVVFDLKGLKVDEDCQRIAVLAQLKMLIVESSSKLGHVWKNVPRGIQGFQNLASIEVFKCDHLRYLFPPSIAKLLVELQSIQITLCSAIRNIFQKDGEEEEADIIFFPKVSSLTLQNLPNLVSFCIEAYSFEWPSIKNINLSDCPKLKTIGSEIQSPRKLKKINGELDSRPHEPGLRSLGFLGQCLECVPCLKNNGRMVVTDQGTTDKSQRSYSVKKEVTLTKPKDLKVGDIDNPLEIRSLFPSHMIECLKNLESINLQNCGSLEVIFELEELNVGESHMASVLDQLRKLILRQLDNLLHIWKKGPEKMLGFENLRLLEVSGCNSLTYLFSPSVAKLLVMLEKIEVTRCEKIEEILARAGEEEEENDVFFCKVNSILLEDLPSLKCFSQETNAFEWPLLKEITEKQADNETGQQEQNKTINNDM